MLHNIFVFNLLDHFFTFNDRELYLQQLRCGAIQVIILLIIMINNYLKNSNTTPDSSIRHFNQGVVVSRSYLSSAIFGLWAPASVKEILTTTVFCPGFLEWWLDSNLLFTVSVAYICIM